MRVYCGKDYEEASRIAANLIAAQVIMKPDCVLGLATGSTPIGTYQVLVEKYKSWIFPRCTVLIWMNTVDCLRKMIRVIAIL